MSDYLINVDYPIDNDPLWKVLEDKYNSCFLKYKGKKKDVIPKKIHQIWLGSPLPIKYFRLIKSWIEKHPDWEYKLWTDKDVEPFGMVNKKLFDSIDNYGIKTDILRYEIIYRHGGLYIDTDFKCIKPMDDLMYLDFFSGSGHTASPTAFCGLFASYPKNPLFLNIIKDIPSVFGKSPKNHGDFIKIQDFYSKHVLDYVSKTKEKAVIFPKNFFYPFPPELRDNADIQRNKDLSKVYSYIKERTYCIHLWFTSWQWETQYVDEVKPAPVIVKKNTIYPKGGGVILSSFLKNLDKKRGNG